MKTLSDTKFLAVAAFAAMVGPHAMAESVYEGEVLTTSKAPAPQQPTNNDDACRFSIAYESETVKVWVCVVPGRRDGANG